MLLNEEEVKKIIGFGEGDTIEFKEQIIDSSDIARQFAAFSNTRGGWILFGVDDKKKVVGLEAGEKEKQLLINTGIIVEEKGKLIPTVAGILLFGKYAQGFLPTATLKAYFFSGKEKDIRFIKDKEDIEGTLPEVIDKALAFIKKNRRIIPDMTGVRRKDIPAYPNYSAKEILANAVAHRDYSLAGAKIEVLMFDDRMEIISPGNLPSSISVERLGIDHFSRNPLIAKVLNQMDYIEEVGMGIKRVREELESLKLPLPKFKNESFNFKVTFLCPKISEEFERKVEKDLNERQKKAVEYAGEKGSISTREYRQITSIGKVYAVRDLNDLVRKGILRVIGKGRATVYTMIGERLVND